MKKTYFSIAFLVSILMLLCGCGNNDLKEDAVYDPRYPETAAYVKQANLLEAQVNDILMHNNQYVELYYQYEDDEAMHKVPNFDKLDKQKVKAVYNVIRYNNGELMSVNEMPYCKTGEWDNEYISLFNEQGNLIKFTRVSMFSIPKEGVAMIEKSDYYYDNSHKLLKKNYTLKDLRNPEKEVDPSTIKSFPYRFDYKKYMTKGDWLEVHGLTR